MRKFALARFHLSTALLLVLSFVVLMGCEGTSGPEVGYYFHKEYLEKPHYKVFFTTGSETYGASVTCSYAGFESALAAVKRGGKRCEEFRKEHYPSLTAGVYLYSLGNIKVWDLTDEQLNKAIEVYENNPDATNDDLSPVKK